MKFVLVGAGVDGLSAWSCEVVALVNLPQVDQGAPHWQRQGVRDVIAGDSVSDGREIGKVMGE